MKSFLVYFTVIIMTACQAFAQQTATGTKKTDLPIVYLPDNLSVHFVSPEPIQYVDISSKFIIGDLPVKNILRIKYRTDSVKTGLKDGVITIVGEKFMAQYHVVYSADPTGGAIQTDIDILPADMQPLDIGISLSQPELKNYALHLLCRKPGKNLQKASAYGIKATLNHVYTIGDYIFLDIGYENSTNLKYDIDELRFKIEDKKVTKATNVQSLEIKPGFTLFDIPSFKKYYRNVFVFKKFTFPGNKLLNIQLDEKQLSGRVITLSIPYKDVLEADIIPVQ
jgi:conjugative transposon TraN protein